MPLIQWIETLSGNYTKIVPVPALVMAFVAEKKYLQ